MSRVVSGANAMPVARLLSIAGLAMVILAAPLNDMAQAAEGPSELIREVEALKQRQDSLERELREVKDLLQRRDVASPPAVLPVLKLDGYPFKGPRAARVVIVEFSEYQCPFCARHVRQTFPRLDRDYIQTGKVRYVLRNFPLESIHPEAVKAAEAALCSSDQQKYWEMHHRLFEHQKELKDLASHAAAVGLDVPSFEKCLSGGGYAALVRGDVSEGRAAGIRGTPTFFVGVPDSNGKTVRAVRVITGAHPFESFRDAIEAVLKDVDE